MSDFAGAPRGGNGEVEGGSMDGELSEEGNPNPQCEQRIGLVGDDGDGLECIAVVAVRDNVRECVRIGDKEVLVVLVNVQV